MTLLVMGPIWNEVYNESIRPYTRGEITDPEDGLERRRRAAASGS